MVTPNGQAPQGQNKPKHPFRNVSVGPRERSGYHPSQKRLGALNARISKPAPNPHRTGAAHGTR